jgi:hypothetical protein
MKNPLSILILLFKCVRPSKIDEMKAVSDPFWLGKGYEALTFFGFIVTHSEQEAEYFNQHDDELKNHEMIHLRQAQDNGDSWWLFYLRYGYYWLRGLLTFGTMRRAGYLLNPFEMEAYFHMHDLEYAEKCRGGAREWRQYARLDYRKRAMLFEQWRNGERTATGNSTKGAKK